MRKTKFRFNTETLEYEKVKTNRWAIAAKVLGYLSLGAIVFSIGVSYSHKLVSSPEEKRLQNQISDYEVQLKLLNDKTEQLYTALDELVAQDENVYREIFGAEPIPSDVRKAGTGGTDKYKALEAMANGTRIKALHEKLDALSAQMKVQEDSYSELIKLAEAKSRMLASIPAIQPISNKDLRRVASGFGYRIDPIYRTRKMHKGIDFSAPKGTEIYATGDGVVKKVTRQRWGYGTHIVISHGYGYTTLYGHMSKTAVRPGQKVKRGQLIGYVGSTGKSTAPHLHYEVAKNGVQVNPIGYFYNDLTPEQYEEIIKLSSHPNQSFD
ncbi:peptidoglycan DD-metalloendopeptidase family protein [bacterium]|nr:peptidoglycan DD-metalloendopeptidase family protein [bacterium]